VTKQNTSPAVISSLVELLETQPGRLRQQYAALNAENTHVFFSHSINALRACEPTARKTALPVLLRLFTEHITLPSSSLAHRTLRDVIAGLLAGHTTPPSSKVPMEAIAHALIEFAFPQENPENPILAVDCEQRQIIVALCAYDPIWKRWRWDTHLQQHGLPGKREDVLALCDVSPNT
jgi:hypothetical protein